MADVEKIAAELRVAIRAFMAYPSSSDESKNALQLIDDLRSVKNLRLLLDELDRLREVERRAKELQRIGGMLANAAYNLSQANLPSDQRKSLRDGQEAWDAAVLQFRLSTQVEERE